MLWKKILVNRQQVPFTSLPNKEVKLGKKLSSPQAEVKFKILTEAQDKFKLPKYHQGSSFLNINYDSYLLIYTGADDYQRAGLEIKIEKMIQQGKEIRIQVGLYSSANQAALEVINLPYDLVKIDKTNLQFTDNNIKFKFTINDEHLLGQKEMKLK